MPTFFDELRDFLASQYALIGEVGSGGMGTVYEAQDKKLPRHVAIKVVPPIKETAIAVERFRNEAFFLARLQHPNIVEIYDVAPEECRFRYFVMRFIEGKTLEKQLVDVGRVDGSEAAKIGRDVLAALGLVHVRHVVHRDVKPSNIFLENGRAILTDFGIAKSLDAHSALTEPNQAPRTPQYAAPEVEYGNAVPQSDFYSLGIVLYEAVTGKPWEKLANPDDADWSGVPDALQPALRRALAMEPADRWPDAESFARSLWEPRTSIPVADFFRRWSALAKAVASVALGAVFVALIWILTHRPQAVDVQIARPAITGEAHATLGDSIAQSVAERLQGFPDFTVAGPAGRWQAKALVSSAVSVTGPSLTIRLDLPPGRPITLSTARSAWRNLSDPLADSLLFRLYQASPLDSQLPRQVLPKSLAGMRAFLDAERAFARASWDSAYIKYRAAQVIDSTCVLCAWRHWEVSKFISVPRDTVDEAVFVAALTQFPAHYQALIRAELVPLAARLDSLAVLTHRWPRFLFGSFRQADELVHRGPLIGRSRREAAIYFQQSVEVRRDFAPAWEHLLWVWIAEGNLQNAMVDLDTLQTLAPASGPATAPRDLLRGAFAWRFLPPAEAARRTAGLIAAAGNEPLDAGARYLNAFDAQAGAVWLGRWLDSANDHRESALLAQMFGYLGLGRPQQARAIQSRLHEQFGDPEVDLFALELEAMGLMFDHDSSPVTQWPRVAQRLREFAGGAGAELRPRAEWMAALLAGHFGRGGVDVGRGAPANLAALVSAVELARRGDYAAALERTDRLEDLESADVGDPFFRTALHLLRAEWNEQRAQDLSADRELTWYENTDVIEFPTGSPQPAEVDWAFGVLARWRRAALQGNQDRCRWYADVARLWTSGEPRYAARADSARRAMTAQHCSESTT